MNQSAYNEDANDHQNEERANGSTNADYEWQEYLPVYEEELTLIGIFVEAIEENLIDETVYTYNVTSRFQWNLEGRTINFWESFRMEIREAKSRGRRGSDFKSDNLNTSSSDLSDDDDDDSDNSSTIDSSECSESTDVSDLLDIATISDVSDDNLSDFSTSDFSDDDSVF
ncbi:hypothetical protein G5I_05176 [Acromyrmex echinatior]|uniref:Uncharacterized protein n=1 Tax=Acromyrmex echinatior TaxID=103372 RepID=F4WHL3_ACREC|nr:hypothetical protein G5I_05176 [Acromyrmex echinatior]